MAVSPESPAREEEKLRGIRSGNGAQRESVLSIDGGGVRSYSSFLILQDLNKRISELEREYDKHEVRPSDDSTTSRSGARESFGHSLPCHYFDYMVGANMGGLAAVMLGRLRMSPRKAIIEFKKLGKFVYNKRRGVLRLLHVHRYNSKHLDTAILKVLNSHLNDKNESGQPKKIPLLQPTALQHECRTVLVSVKRSQGAIGSVQGHMFRTYISQPRNSTDARINPTSRRPFNPGDNSPVWLHEAIRAAISTPFSFPEADINGYRFIDGGVKFNNPSLEAFWEATIAHQHRKPPFQCGPDTEAVGVIISIGSGKSKKLRTIKKMQYGHKVFSGRGITYDSFSDPDPVHDQMRQQAEYLRIPYFRFEVEDDLDKIPMDAWDDSTLRKIEDATRLYLDLETTIAELNQAAEYVVAYRRGRQAAARRARDAHHRSREPPPPTTHRNGFPTGSDNADPWNPRPTHGNAINRRPLPRAQTWQPGNTRGQWEGPWPNGTLVDQPHELLTPPPPIPLPNNVVELPDHRQDPLEASDSYVPTRSYTMPVVPTPAYRLS